MKAIVYTKYGPPEVLKIKELNKPVPKDNEVLIKVHASSVSAPDYKIRGFYVAPLFWLPARMMYGLFKPKQTVPGAELAGEIIAIGRNVTSFKIGDQVFGYDASHMGAYAEFVCRKEESALAIKPVNISHAEAATIPHGALTALHFLRNLAKIKRHHKVLIYGASGSVGTAAVQIARHFQANVTGVCSTANQEMVKSLGADHVIDYTKEDFCQNGQLYDIIFDTVGKTRFSHCKRSLSPHGYYLYTVFGFIQLMQMLWTSMFGQEKVICAIASEKKEDLVFIKELVETGKLKPVIDRSYPLENIAEAHRYADQGHKKGNIVITITNS